MTLFGQEIDLGFEIELNEKTAGILVTVSSVVLIALVGFFLIASPIKDMTKTNKQISKKEKELLKYEQSNKKIKNNYENLNKIYQDQQENLESIRKKFENASLRDETDLKIAIQEIIDYLDLDLVSTGASEIAEDKPEYVKKYTEYIIKGEFYKLGRFFYYLENSNWLLTFKGSDLIMEKMNVDKKSRNSRELVQVRFKIGAYIIKGGGR